VIRPCPFCASALYGGPVLYGCIPCGRSVYAADIHTETHTTHTYRPQLEVQ
jgi:hypothetical protein